MDIARIRNFKTHMGYTLTEVICCIAIFSIFASFAVPAYSSLISKQKMLTSITAFQHFVMLARSESIQRSQYVVICPSLDGIQCLQDTKDYSTGWISFVNSDRDYPAMRDSHEILLQSFSVDPSGFSLLANRKTFTFRPNHKRNTNGTLMLCPENNIHNYQALIISYTGRPRMDKQPIESHIAICNPI